MNNSKYWLVWLVILGGVLFGIWKMQWQDKQANGAPMAIDRTTCLADECLATDLEYPAGQLPADVVKALVAALDDEYKAYATYQAVIEKLGTVRPFAMIIGAEEQHIAQLKSVYTKYGLEPFTNPYLGKVVSPQTKAEACSLGIQAEVANVALYRDELLPLVGSYLEITTVFRNLMNASEQKHLPAFQRCAI